MLVQTKKTDDFSVTGPDGKWKKAVVAVRPALEELRLRSYRGRKKLLFSSAWLPGDWLSRVNKANPDIVHLFWVNGGFLRIEHLKHVNRPIVWTLHDMWPFTGGCHYDDECGAFRESCGQCPLLNSEQEQDLSRKVWSRKKASWSNVPMVIVATSHWLADMARASSLFRDQRIEVIPNGIDTDKYKPLDKAAARAAYNLPQDKRLILFSAVNAVSDKRKGGQFLIPALQSLAANGWSDSAELVIIGASRPEIPLDLGLPVHYVGHLHDEISQVLLYSAADVVVAPSVQENLSNTVLEALACGIPVVAFDVGGMPDMIDHQSNGYLATPFQVDDLVNGIAWVLENDVRHGLLSKTARDIVLDRYDLPKIAKRYSELYESITLL
ncbi:glycosyltransferase family 4 protein [Herbaspirillum lusitanum]|uniref:glycosyltransferase family 4 protein n=1 Tax=Herbaspirillum lusitanum TaxID=213312 RepID=UPI0002EBD4D6|nr:glycosyltransferase family 4 protein [Herbaspirillum lusitanum]